MAYEKSVDMFEISRSMFMYPWLEYPDRAKEFRKVMAPVHLPLSCYKMPKEELPLSPDFWRQHPSKPHSVPYCYSKKPEIYTHWHTLYDQRKEREAQKMLLKMRGHHPKDLKDSSQKFRLPMSKLITKSQVGSGTLEPTRDHLKWQRLKELTKTLESPRENDQFYATQALGYLGISEEFIMKALWQVAQTGPKKVKCEAYRTLAILGCLNKNVIQALIKQLKEESKRQGMETLIRLRMALNSWAAVPEDKRTQVENEEELVLVLQRLIKSSSCETALEAALCLGFLRPCSNIAQEFLLQCLSQGTKTQQMKALRMLVKIMNVNSAVVTRAILTQLCSSSVIEDRFEATQMLRTIGQEEIKAQGLEELTFDLLKWKTHCDPFFALRQAVAETVEKLNMKPMMMNQIEVQLMDPDATARQQAVISLGVLGIRGPQVFHLLLDMLDTEENQAVKKSLQETLIIWASIDPWIQKKLKNKVFFVYEAPKNRKTEPTRFRTEPEEEELTVRHFQLARLNPLLVAKASTKVDQKKKVPDFPSDLSQPQKQKSQTTGPWQPRIRQQLRALAENHKQISSLGLLSS
ncbi:PREDICTED: protein HEATR9 isoform X1 [Chinchilla lanigera]|uniref:HEAT repeat containing 9 n=1 Tax=Chinchilla lanigera TaxID=34839 RepID=A0A8C2VKE9_CHILA|nr:PREDICTED: protein HEATR9 isoform X1 [Chinchilla lanigera]